MATFNQDISFVQGTDPLFLPISSSPVIADSCQKLCYSCQKLCILLFLSNSCDRVYSCNNFSYDCIYSTNVSVTNCCVRRHHYFLASGRPRLCLTPLNTTQSPIGQVTSTSTTQPLIGPFTSSTTTQPLIGPVTSSTTTQPLSF